VNLRRELARGGALVESIFCASRSVQLFSQSRPGGGRTLALGKLGFFRTNGQLREQPGKSEISNRNREAERVDGRMADKQGLPSAPRARAALRHATDKWKSN